MKKNIYGFVAGLGFIVLLFAFFQLPVLHQSNNLNKINKKEISTSSPRASVDMKKARDEYFFRMLKDPATGQLPPNYRARELDFAKKLNKKLGKNNSTNAFVWQEAGPTDVGGRTRALAVDVANSNTILAGGVSGGIWKSIDKGVTWTMKSTTSQILSVTSIAQDTRVGNTSTWYFSTGEFRGNSASGGGSASFGGTGIFKSTDNGETWTKIQSVAVHPFTSQFNYVSRIVVSPTTGSVFIASNAFGIYRSQNGGTSWTRVKGATSAHTYSDVIVAKNGTVIVFLSKSGNGSGTPGIFKSTDDGNTWTNITPSTYPTTNYTRAYLASAPSNPDILYVLTDNGVQSNGRDVVSFHKITVSTGASEDRSSNIPDFSNEGLPSSGQGVFDVQGSYNMMVAIHPENPNIVIIGGTNLFRSFDGFATKPTNRKNTWIAGYHPTHFLYPNHHPDQHSFAFDPVNINAFWSGHDGGIAYTPDITDTNYADVFPWTDKNKTYNVTQFYTVAIYDSSSDKRIMGGAQDNGTPYFTFTGTTTSPSSDVSSGDGAYAFFKRNYALTGSQEGRVNRLRYTGASKMPDWNNNWSVITPSGASGQLFINPLVPDPNDENYLYYLSGSQLWRNNSVNTIPNFQNKTTVGWTQLTNNSAPGGYNYTAIAISKSNSSDVLYYAASSTGNGFPKLYKLTNARTSTATATDLSSALAGVGVTAGSYISSIAVNPNNSDEVIVVVSNYAVPSLFYTTDGGAKFVDIEGNLSSDSWGGTVGPSIRTASILPFSSGTVYLVGTSTGLYSTTDVNTTSPQWRIEGDQTIGNVVVDYISGRTTADRYVAIATHGRGIFTGVYTPATAVNDENQLPTNYTLSQNYPNPFNPSTNINFSLPQTGKVVITLFDALGRKVTDIVNKEFSAGNHSINFNASRLSSGVYFYRLQTDKFVQSKKMILLR